MNNKKQNKSVKNFINKTRILGDELKTDIQNFLIREYNKKSINFGPASPYGQILTVLQELNDMQYFYLEDALNERNVYTAFKKKSIYGLSRLTGHNPHRGSSARGEISIKFKPGAANEIPGNNIQINNYTKLICETNNKFYTILLNSDNVILPKTSSDIFRFNIIEGSITTNTFNGNNENLQSYNVPSRFEIIDQFFVKVFVNGQEMTIKESLYDIRQNENAVIVKTGINGGIDIYFGNEDYGYIPKLGELIEVQWVKSSGLAGNITVPSKDVVIKFAEEVFDGFDGSLDLNELFDISVTKSITMGSNGEDKELTKQLLNKNSRSLVLANPDNYKHFLSRYSQFKYVNAYNKIGGDYLDDNNIVYLTVLPDITLKIQSGGEYFNSDESIFLLTDDEKTAIYRTIAESGQQLISTELVIQTPETKRYATNIFIKVFEDILSEDVIKAEVVEKIGTYFLNFQRRNVIPRSDLVKIVEEIEGVDSVYVEFVSEENETALRNGFYYKKIKYTDEQKKQNTLNITNSSILDNLSLGNSVETEKQIFLEENEDPNLGLDDFGDISITEDQLPLVRGGFLDRNSVLYEQGYQSDKLCGVNIIISGYSKR